MKRVHIHLILGVILILTFQLTVAAQEPHLSIKSMETATQVLNEPIPPSKGAITPLYGSIISDIRTSRPSFNPGNGEEVAIYYNLSKPASVSARIYDPDRGLITTIAAEKDSRSGEQTIIWNGRDLDGNIVPDEAYFFTVTAEDETGKKDIYDPTTFSGGVEHDITTSDFSPENGTINYKMPEMGRVLIRIGIQGGPLLNTLVDWKPRVNGMITEYWNGKDKDNLVDLYNNPKFKMIITYFSLPENSIISFGNKDLNYRAYKKALADKRPVKAERASTVSKASPHYRLLRTADYSPELTVTLTNNQGMDNNGNIILNEKALVKVELDEQDKVIFQNQQFEIVFFLDNEFYAEDEAGYTPFNWVWDLSNVKAGEHLLTVNLSGFKDQIGVKSYKVKIVE